MYARAVLASLFAISAGVLGCPSQEALGTRAVTILGAGVVNNPSNKSLRFDILKFGLERFCFEMLRRGAPLKMNDDQPVIGRFFAESCQSQVIDDEHRKSFVVQYAGKGYAWVAALGQGGRVGFTSAGLVEYAPDFQLHEGEMYVYFRPRRIDATSFQTLMIDSAFLRLGAAVINADETGRRIVTSQLQRGFTVIRYGSEGETDFGMGYVQKGRRPFKPFQVSFADKLQLANDRTEVHAGQQDMIGGFEVTDDDQAIYLTMSLDGSPAVDVFLVQKGVGDMMIDRFVRTSGPAPLPAPPLLDDPLLQGQLYKRFVRVPKGLYYLVIDHSSEVGRTAPPVRAGDDRAAKVDYLIQVGDAP